ncbi:LmrA/YxaF family transcription factor [Kovacikia minuta]|uniref:LmrA/YxaF family transcription factor n=1 Tax=Kovacikia minuta TaxID=2931930 RepID=UPI0028F4080B|nr:hypothetical protein [Kovacikia minuta]
METLEGEGDALTRLQQMCDRISQVYEGGEKPCLLAALLLGSAKEVFQPQLYGMLQTWINAIARVLIAAGMDETLARQRGENGVIAIQGALMVSQGLGDTAPFQRVIYQLPQELCRGL